VQTLGRRGEGRTRLLGAKRDGIIAL